MAGASCSRTRELEAPPTFIVSQLYLTADDSHHINRTAFQTLSTAIAFGQIDLDASGLQLLVIDNGERLSRTLENTEPASPILDHPAGLVVNL